MATHRTWVQRVENFGIKSSHCERPLGVKLDHKQSFNNHIWELCKKATEKAQALARVTPYMNILKEVLLETVSLNHN